MYNTYKKCTRDTCNPLWLSQMSPCSSYIHKQTKTHTHTHHIHIVKGLVIKIMIQYILFQPVYIFLFEKAEKANSMSFMRVS